ncbi:aldolase catalytic domain-containing protein [Marinobacter bryozoorum]|uniref:aldolase catalytic domain-containing protein n=1 Tax=Marinobacter bryozoorum TaxID=256324 RepID=UPI00200694C7|nr:aldolase catalytic domain-containing protein [Marinobacter bryozoorum]MCK7544779.1 aldolase catalytic domain-containing protein [Marinobacter bryozoorum]
MGRTSLTFLDCTLRDGGYYNNWDFDADLVRRYLRAMTAAGVNVVEMGLRSLRDDGFKGACAYSTDEYLASLGPPPGLDIGVMVNAAELVGGDTVAEPLALLFPRPCSESPVDLVRIACHVHEFGEALEASTWLKDRGYRVGFNLMQVADQGEAEIEALAQMASRYPLDVLYFADSLGSMGPEHSCRIVGWLRRHWQGELGIHTHDNLRMALQNTLAAMDAGVTWVDSTVTGMGRGPGNARTEELAIEIAAARGEGISLVPLMQVIRSDFRPMQERFGWGTNPFYYLAGRYRIHPTYIQEMLSDSRYSEEDVLAVIEHLRVKGGKKFSFDALDSARHFYRQTGEGRWQPRSRLDGREVLLLGTGPGVSRHRWAIESYIRRHNPVVIALNTQAEVDAGLIDLRVACHPVRLLADQQVHSRLPQPLITPWSTLSDELRASLADKEVLDYGLRVETGRYEFGATSCTLPTSLVVAYALAIASGGNACRVLMAGFDGYSADDPRTREMRELLTLYQQTPGARELLAVTPTRHEIPERSIYAM